MAVFNIIGTGVDFGTNSHHELGGRYITNSKEYALSSFKNNYKNVKFSSIVVVKKTYDDKNRPVFETTEENCD